MIYQRFKLSKLPHGRKRDYVALLVILAVWLAFFWRLFTPVEADRVQLASGDFTLQFLAFRRFGLSELRQGRWPLWMPCVDSGYPYFADPQAASFYPPALLNYAGHLMSGTPEFSLVALQWEAALHILLAALLSYLFLRGEVRSRAAALIAQRIKKAQVIAYEELGAEALQRLEVEDFPVIVVNDIYGGDAYEEGKKQWARK